MITMNILVSAAYDKALALLSKRIKNKEADIHLNIGFFYISE